MKFDKPPSCYWNLVTKINSIQRRIIIYSLQYYKLGMSCVSDKYYDDLCRQLVAMMDEATEEQRRNTQYYYIFYDFDGSTGFDLESRLNKKDRMYLTHLAGIFSRR